MKKESKNKDFNMFWPNIDDIEDAKGVAKGAAFIPAFVSVVTTIIVLVGIFYTPILGLDEWAFIDAFLFALVAFGMWKLNRVVAILGLALYVWGQLQLLSVHGSGTGVMAVFFVIMWFNGIRASLRYHKLLRAPKVEENATT
ncbi:MAG: hypothetical protein KKE30_03805 [Gammaproteobacteria bacterium]|nr:hypothetical protein [Gammaproteobacteria bacterium]MBU1555708.1 hypothetical protein [Gammaproteobacteria bacterium]MBU2206158.1 hypothetical protein [Gammaproteobacteria bacterium]